MFRDLKKINNSSLASFFLLLNSLDCAFKCLFCFDAFWCDFSVYPSPPSPLLSWIDCKTSTDLKEIPYPPNLPGYVYVHMAKW